MRCINCGEPIENIDDRVGVIHKNNLYACYGKNENGKVIRLETVAEESSDLSDELVESDI